MNNNINKIDNIFKEYSEFVASLNISESDKNKLIDYFNEVIPIALDQGFAEGIDYYKTLNILASLPNNNLPS